ncbi:MAG TPA: lamin tail domain-containing protein, partial [Flavobacteriales bacterium]|nr:lamin tail domain-containing protein [Flavobacteriales bacterium]
DYPDQNGQLDDWIELYNADTQTVSIAGYYITDLISNPTKFQFPQITAQTTMEPGSFKVLWADQNTIQGPLHLNFTLSATGGFVGLFAPDGETLIDGAQYPAMSEGNSYGRYLDGADNWKLLFYATPGAPNSDSIPPVGILSGIDFESGISLFPNPANQQVNVVKTGEALTGSINLYVMDLQGRKITAPVNNLIFGKRWTIDTSTLPSGSYILVMQSRDGIRNARFSKTN